MGPRDDAQLAQARRHVVTENLRTQAAAEALAANDLVELGRLMPRRTGATARTSRAVASRLTPWRSWRDSCRG